MSVIAPSVSADLKLPHKVNLNRKQLILERRQIFLQLVKERNGSSLSQCVARCNRLSVVRLEGVLMRVNLLFESEVSINKTGRSLAI